MDERAVFERFHEAFELEPQPGAYERFRAAFTVVPPTTKRRPVFRLRFTRMSLRIAAAVAVVAIAIALVAGVLATRHSSVGDVPATVDPNTKAYRTLMEIDYNLMNTSTSNHCNTIDDTECAAAIERVNTALAKWIADLKAYHTPAALVPLDALIRAHLQAVIDRQTAAIAFQRAHDVNDFTLAMNASFYERAWIDPATFAVDGTYQKLAGSYNDAVGMAARSLEACMGTSPGPADRACNELLQAPACTGLEAPTCLGYVQDTSTQFETFLIALLQNPAPSRLAKQNSQLQTELVQADTALISLVDAMLRGSSSDITAAEDSLDLILTKASDDASTLAHA